MRKHLIILFISSLNLLISCSKDSEGVDNNTQDFYFNLNKTKLISSSSETEIKVEISSNTNWEVLSKPDWAMISPSSGNENSEIKITVLENKNQDSRSDEIKFKFSNNFHSITITQEGYPLQLIDYSGMDSPLKMTEPKYLLFNKPITVNSISSGSIRYAFDIDLNDVEYYNNGCGIKFTGGHSSLGEKIKYKVLVTDNDNKSIENIVEFQFYSQQIIVLGAIKKMILDENKNLWVLSLKPYTASSTNSYITKFKENEGKYEEVYKFQVDISLDNSDYRGGSFFINPYNDLIYIPDYEEEEVDVYSKDGFLIKQIQIPGVESDHSVYPHSSPVFIGFNKDGKGLLSLAGKGISNQRWRYIDSSKDDLITQPSDNHKYFYNSFIRFVSNFDNTKLYIFESQASVNIKLYTGEEDFEEINLNEFYPEGANASGVIQNRLYDKVFVSGLYSSNIMSGDLSYFSEKGGFSLLGDFDYNPDRQNHIYGFHEYNLKLLDYDNKETVLDLRFSGLFDWTHKRGIITTPDDGFIITYADGYNYKGDSQIVIFNTEMFK